MATQRLTVATLTGAAAEAVADQFAGWRTTPNPVAVDQFCLGLRDHAPSLAVAYFAEWVDRWLMGDLVPGPGTVEARQFQATVMSPEQAVTWAARCRDEVREEKWLATQLRTAREAATDTKWDVVVVVREVTGPSATDEEIRAAADLMPNWLRSREKSSEPAD